MSTKILVKREHFRKAVKALRGRNRAFNSLACNCPLAQAFVEHFKAERATADWCSVFVKGHNDETSKEYSIKNREVSHPIQTMFDSNYSGVLSADRIFKLTQTILRDKGLKMVVELDD